MDTLVYGDSEMMKPKYDGYTVDTSWDSSDELWWGKYVSVYLVDASISRFSLRSGHKRNIGPPLSLLVCSPSFKQSPNDQVSKEELRKAYVQDKFKGDDVAMFLRRSIDDIGVVELGDFERKASEIFVMTEWLDEENQAG